MVVNMKNDIYHIDKQQAKELLSQQRDKKTKVVHIECKKITSWKEYSIQMEKTLDFPRPVDGSPNRFLDWIRDLSWQNYDRYDVFIYNFMEFSSRCFADAYEVYKEFKEIIFLFGNTKLSVVL